MSRILRTEAITLLHEIVTSYAELLNEATHISLQMSGEDTRLILKSRLDFAQKKALIDILRNRGWKVVDCASGFETVLVVY